MYLEVVRYVEENGLFDPYQSAYRTGFSTETALTKVLDDVRDAMDKRRVTILVMVDFSSAFDLIRKDILLAGLRSIGIQGRMLSWFGSYLSDRSQRVRGADNGFSSWRDVDVGCPQGSVLSALMFILYVKTLPDVFSDGTQHMMYADDLQLYRSCSVSEIGGAVGCLNRDLSLLADWCRLHGMRVNESKTKVIVLGYTKILPRVSALPNVMIASTPLAYVDEVRNLGILVQSNLSWDRQVDHMCQAVAKGTYQLRRVASDFPFHVRKQLAQALILPSLDYAPVALCDLNGQNMEKLQRAQNLVIRFVLKLKPDEHVTPHYKALGWLKVRERKRLQLAVMVFKTLKFQRPGYLYERFHFMSSIHTVNTRNRDQIMRVPAHRTSLLDRSFVVQGTRIFNELKEHFDMLKSTVAFRETFKKKMLEQY